ncbi:hypothetical protein [Corallococcus sp. RDP092CA]|uniref:hypothetical protein n=1 Tax=Corallococcus sp. RDP092CA TaxID=3109369 RepID=UPI0035ADB4D4
MRRLLLSSLAVLSLQSVACGAGAEEAETQAPPAAVADDKTQLGPINGLKYGTHVTYYSDSTHTVEVGMAEWGCPPSTYLVNWGVESGYSSTWKFLCAMEPQG